MIIGFVFAESPFYGVQTHFGQYRRADMDSASVELQLDLVSAAGIDMIRDECLWSDVETDSGVYVIPPAIDRYVQAAIARDIDIYMILNYNNSIYAPATGSGVTTEENRIAYAKYCQAVVGHFSPLGVKHYEIWNEPNHGVLFWTPQPDPNDYTLLLQTAYDSIKALDSSVTVIGCATSPAIGNPAPYIEGLDFIRDVFAAGGGDYMDGVSFHLYQIAYRPENELRSYVSEIKSYVGNKPIYFSEFGYPTHSGWPNISLSTQAKYVNRMFLICQMDPQIKTAIYYDLKNDGTVAEEPEHNFGLLSFDASPKPAYEALHTLIRKTHGQRPVSSIDDNDVYISRYSDSLFVAWAYSGSRSYKYYSNSISTRVENMYGDTIAYHINGMDTLTISVDESPKIYTDLDRSPEIATFNLKADELLLYPGETVEMSYEAATGDGIPIYPDVYSVNWDYTGDQGQILNGTFTSNASGEGMIIAGIQGFKDTVFVTTIEDPSIHIVDNFSDTSEFTLESGYLDMNSSNLSLSADDQLELNYTYSGSGAIAYIHKDILINHLADSIYLDIKTDEKEYDVRVYCKDMNGASYTLYMKPRPTDWTNTWGTVSSAMEISTSAVAPVKITKIYLKLRPGSTTQTEPYSGTILFRALRIKKGLVVSTKEIVPNKLYLSQNYPNPFNGNTVISFELPRRSQARIDIFNLNGKLVSTAVNSVFDAGVHNLNLSFDNVPSGVYIYRLCTGTHTITNKLVYLK
jgi:hypothetical protein